MTFIVTAHGQEIDVRYPRPQTVTLGAMAHSLAQINRFTGHAVRPYSVAEHSLLVCEIAERELRCNVDGLFAALMHDAHECISGDMHTPGKGEIGYEWGRWEDKWETFIRRAFSVHAHSLVHGAAVKKADLMALATERRDLMPPTPTPWPCLEGIQPVSWVNLLSIERERMTWNDWRERFIDRHDELEFARNNLHFGGEPESGFSL